MTRLAIAALISAPLMGCLDIPGASHPIVQGALSGATDAAIDEYLTKNLIGQRLTEQCAIRAAQPLDVQMVIDATNPRLAGICDRLLGDT